MTGLGANRRSGGAFFCRTEQSGLEPGCNIHIDLRLN